jgi:hypothetical protein
MKFCPECGARQEGSPKFCTECGTRFLQDSVIPTPAVSPPPQVSRIPAPTKQPSVNRYELGLKLEEVVEKIFLADGYTTLRRQRIQGVVKGYTNEIDIIATRGNEKIAIECKNLSSPVGISQMRDFAEKILDLGPGWRGIFVGFSDFTEDASHFAESRNIEQLDIDEVTEKWFALSVGRSSKQGEKISIEQALPVNTDYIKATWLDLFNNEKIIVSDVKLLFHPYIRYKYTFKRTFHDPTKTQHKFFDQGTIVVDLIDNEVVNKPVVKNVSGIAHAITQTFTSRGNEENTRRKLIFHEVVDNTPLSEICLNIGQDYRVTKLTVDYSKRDVTRTALEYIIDKNSQRVTYSIESRNSFPEVRNIDFVPDRKDISIDNGEVVYVPKWQIHFNAFGTIYNREVLACSGIKLEDTIAFCPHHFKLGIMEIHQKNVAVCEKCGAAFCKTHGRHCEVCKIHLCENHAITCSSCKRSFCEDHITRLCGLCGKYVCKDCIQKCKICGKDVGLDHMVKCDSCGTIACSNCVKVTGLLKKKTTCKKCQ